MACCHDLSVSEKTEQTTPPEAPAAERENRLKVGLRWVVIVAAGLIVGFAVYLILASIVPRAWAQSIGRQVNGRISTGIMVGLVYGGVFTFLPVLLVAQIARRGLSWKAKGLLVIGAIVLAIPNLMTLSVVAGSSNAAHDGQRILSVQAPGFRYAVLWGAILGMLLGLGAAALTILFERRGDEVKLLRARVQDLEAELAAARPPLQTLVGQPDATLEPAAAEQVDPPGTVSAAD